MLFINPNLTILIGNRSDLSGTRGQVPPERPSINWYREYYDLIITFSIFVTLNERVQLTRPSLV